MKIKFNNLLIFIIIIQCLLYIFFFPNLDSPDAIYHVSNIINTPVNDNNIYSQLLFSYGDFLRSLGLRIDMPTIKLKGKEYFSGQPWLYYDGYNFTSVMWYQLAQLFLVIVAILLFNTVVKINSKLTVVEKNFLLRIGLLYFLYPEVSYLIMGIAPDFLTYVYQPFNIYFIYTKKHILNIFMLTLITFFADEGAALSLLFVIIYIFYDRFINFSILFNRGKWIVFNVTLFCVLFYLSRNILSLFFFDNVILQIMMSSQELYGTMYTKIIYIFLSSFCFLGSGNYITFPPLYLGYLIVLIIILKRNFVKKNSEDSFFFKLLLASISVIGIIITLFPPYAHVRYFLFFVLTIIIGFQYYIVKDYYLENISSFQKQTLFLFLHNALLILFISFNVFVFK